MENRPKEKTLKILSNIAFTVFMTVMVVLIFMAGQSKLTGKEPSILGYRFYIVDSGSMEPTLPINSLIGVKEKSGNEVEVGDILTYYTGDESTRITHRLVDIGPNREYFITKGDANNTEDSNPIKKNNIIGVVTFSLPYLGYIFRFLSSIPGIVFLVGLMAVFAISPSIFRKFAKEV